jgi:hypothetical protein
MWAPSSLFANYVDLLFFFKKTNELTSIPYDRYCRNVKPYSARDENFDELKVKMESGHGDW